MSATAASASQPSSKTWAAAERSAIASVIVSLPAWWLEEGRDDPGLADQIRQTAINAIADLRDSGIEPERINSDVRALVVELIDTASHPDAASRAIALVIRAAGHLNEGAISTDTRRSGVKNPTAEVSDIGRWRAQLDQRTVTGSLKTITASEPPSKRITGRIRAIAAGL